jgi:16S rRNA (cytidine1402-2'-O)-methyltransferase
MLANLKLEKKTMIFLEAPSRILDTLDCMQNIFGFNRRATFCRELTKKFETIKQDSLNNIYSFIIHDKSKQTKGEIVLVVAGNTENICEIDDNAHNILQCLSKELPLTQAASLTAKITGLSKKTLYNYAITTWR